MAVNRKVEREILRETYLNEIIDYFRDHDEVLRVKSNEIAIPVVGCEGNEDYIVITVKVPTGANKGTEPYDGYELAQDYEMKLAEKKEKAKRKEKEKAKKIAKDKEIREKKKSAEWHSFLLSDLDVSRLNFSWQVPLHSIYYKQKERIRQWQANITQTIEKSEKNSSKR